MRLNCVFFAYSVAGVCGTVAGCLRNGCGFFFESRIADFLRINCVFFAYSYFGPKTVKTRQQSLETTVIILLFVLRSPIDLGFI